MDREVVPRSCKICGWLLNPSRDHFGLHQGKNVRVTMEFEVRKRHVIRPTLATAWSNGFLWWERQKWCSDRKRQGPMAKKCCYNELLMTFFFGGRERRRQENGQFLKIFSFQNSFENDSFFGAWSFLLVHIWFPPSEGPKGFVNFELF